MIYFLCASFAMVAYIIGGFFIWNVRAYELYRKRISAPWTEAIERYRRTGGGTEEIEYWKQMALDYELQNINILLNPVAWVRYWNWKPVPYDAFDARVKRWN